MSSPTPQSAPAPAWQIGPAIAAWILPGLGHWILGDKKRGVILLIAVYSLFVSGLLIGGIDVIDPQDKVGKLPLWYMGQCLVGPPAPILGNVHEGRMKKRQYNGRTLYIAPDPPGVGEEDPGYIKSIGRVHELGQLYCTMAGMLNLLIILDVLTRPSTRQARTRSTDTNGGKLITREGN